MSTKGKVKVVSYKHLLANTSGIDTGLGMLRNTAMDAENSGPEPIGHSPENSPEIIPRLFGL